MNVKKLTTLAMLTAISMIVFLIEASCPDQICVRHGPTDQTADPIVCLPNKLVVRVLPPEGEADQLDGVSS